jgi:NosR/NirI family nitrous oxide reductase transcriptional regulator
MKALAVFLLIVFVGVAGVLGAGGQTSEAALQARLKQLFPAATRFSPKTGNPPHFKAYGKLAGGEPTLVGFAFYSTELEPLERAYDGPIQILVGVDLRGLLAGIIVVDHNEPYGYFSVDTPEFAAQFASKSIRDRFRVGDDIDAISTATISVRSAARAVRNGSRRIARQFLNPEDVR